MEGINNIETTKLSRKEIAEILQKDIEKPVSQIMKKVKNYTLDSLPRKKSTK